MNEKGNDEVIKRKEGKIKEIKRKKREDWKKDERRMLGGRGNERIK